MDRGIYNYVFWYNEFTEIWYGIPTDEYQNFFSGKREEAKGVYEAKNINNLIVNIQLDKEQKDIK